MIITMRDVRRIGCKDGLLDFFKRHPHLDKRDFLKNGISSEVLIATGDLLALRVVEAAQEANTNGR